MDRGVTTTRLLVIHPGALGDTLLALPVLAALKQRYEPAALDFIGHPSLVDVLPGRSIVDRMRPIDGPEFHSLFVDISAMRSAMKEYFSDFDIAVVWITDSEGQARKTLSTLGVPQVVVRSPFLHAVGSRHATERFADTLTELRLSECLSAPCLVPTDDDLEIGGAWLAQAGLNPNTVPVVAVHPGSGSAIKCWPTESYAETVTDLLDHGAAVVVIEGPADTEAVSTLQRTVGTKRLPRLAGVGLTTVVGVLAQCCAFLGNDSGLTHVAANLGLPTIAVFGPTDPTVWAPRGDHVIALRSESGCRCLTQEEQSRCFCRPCLAVPSNAVRGALYRALLGPSASLAT